MILNLALKLPEDSHFVPIARHLSNTLLTDLNVMKEDVQAVETIIGELCNNVVAHSDGQKYSILLEYYAERTVITVQDNGPGFSFRDIPPVGSTRKDHEGRDRVGGFGLLLVESLADKVEFRRVDPHGMTVRAEIPLRYSNAADILLANRLNEGEESGDNARSLRLGVIGSWGSL